MKAEHTLKVQRRERTGTRYSKRSREVGMLPCVLYGQGKDPAHLLLSHKEAIRFFESGERVFEIELESEGSTQTVLLKDLQFGHLGNNVVHCDLMRVELADEITANVHVRMTGDAKLGAGDILVQKINELPVKCTVASLPDEITVSVEGITGGSVVTASQVELPDGVKLDIDGEAIVVVVTTSGGGDASAEDATDGEEASLEA